MHGQDAVDPWDAAAGELLPPAKTRWVTPRSADSAELVGPFRSPARERPASPAPAHDQATAAATESRTEEWVPDFDETPAAPTAPDESITEEWTPDLEEAAATTAAAEAAPEEWVPDFDDLGGPASATLAGPIEEWTPDFAEPFLAATEAEVEVTPPEVVSLELVSETLIAAEPTFESQLLQTAEPAIEAELSWVGDPALFAEEPPQEFNTADATAAGTAEHEPPDSESADAAQELAERLEMVARQLRAEDPDALLPRLLRGDRFDALLAGVLVGYLSARDG